MKELLRMAFNAGDKWESFDVWYRAIIKPNSLEQTEVGGQFLKTSQTKENQQRDEQLLLKHAVIKSVCEKHQWHFFRVERIRQCQVCGKMENY